jgi:predicted metal-dependent peptidase
MNGRDGETWNQACDFAINGELLAQNFVLPKGALVDSRFSDMSAEDIYRKLEQEKKDQQKQNQGKTPQNGSNAQQGQGSGQSAPSFGQIKPAKDPASAEAKGKAVLEKAMSIARMAGEMPGELERELKENAKPRFDWREILHRFFQDVCSRDYSFQQPNKRFAHLGVILPTLRSRSIGKVLLAVDTSGSISTEEVSAMVAEMQECLVAYADEGLTAELTVIYCDAAVQRVETLSDGDTPKPLGGGGTDYKPVFSYVGNDIGDAACLVYLTDGDCASFPEVAPSFPVLWGLIRDNPGFNPPFGEVFKVEVFG